MEKRAQMLMSLGLRAVASLRRWWRKGERSKGVGGWLSERRRERERRRETGRQKAEGRKRKRLRAVGLAGVRMASWGTRGVATPSVSQQLAANSQQPATSVHPLVGALVLGDEVDARVTASSRESSPRGWSSSPSSSPRASTTRLANTRHARQPPSHLRPQGSPSVSRIYSAILRRTMPVRSFLFPPLPSSIRSNVSLSLSLSLFRSLSFSMFRLFFLFLLPEKRAEKRTFFPPESFELRVQCGSSVNDRRGG